MNSFSYNMIIFRLLTLSGKMMYSPLLFIIPPPSRTPGIDAPASYYFDMVNQQFHNLEHLLNKISLNYLLSINIISWWQVLLLFFGMTTVKEPSSWQSEKQTEQVFTRVMKYIINIQINKTTMVKLTSLKLIRSSSIQACSIATNLSRTDLSSNEMTL